MDEDFDEYCDFSAESPVPWSSLAPCKLLFSVPLGFFVEVPSISASELQAIEASRDWADVTGVRVTGAVPIDALIDLLCSDSCRKVEWVSGLDVDAFLALCRVERSFECLGVTIKATDELQSREVDTRLGVGTIDLTVNELLAAEVAEDWVRQYLDGKITVSPPRGPYFAPDDENAPW